MESSLDAQPAISYPAFSPVTDPPIKQTGERSVHPPTSPKFARTSGWPQAHHSGFDPGRPAGSTSKPTTTHTVRLFLNTL